MAGRWLSGRAIAAPAVDDSPERPETRRLTLIPNDGSTLSAVLYWLRYKSFWFPAIMRVATINGIVGLILWAVDQATGRQNETLLQIRSNLPLTLFVAALIALAFAVGRLGLTLDVARPFANPAVFILILAVIVGVTSVAGPVFVAIGEAAALLLLLAALRLRYQDVNAYLVLKAVLIASSVILLGGLGSGIVTGQLLETRFSVEAVDGLLRLVGFMLGMSLYMIEERRYWWTVPPVPVVVEQLQKACKQNDFGAVQRWLGPELVFSQGTQRLLSELILPRRIMVDGDLAAVANPTGALLFVRVHKGLVTELQTFEEHPLP